MEQYVMHVYQPQAAIGVLLPLLVLSLLLILVMVVV